MSLKIFSEAEHLILGFPGLVPGPKGITGQPSGCECFISSLADEYNSWNFISLAQGTTCQLYHLGEKYDKWRRPHTPVLLPVDNASSIPGGLVKIWRFSRSLRRCISSKFPGGIDAFGLRTTFGKPLPQTPFRDLGHNVLHNALCFFVAGSCCHLGTTVFPFQGIPCFLFSVLNSAFLLPPQLWISCRMSPARPPLL